MLWSFQYEVVETTPAFNISSLFWDTEYCVSVEPNVASRQIRALRTAEECVTIGGRDSEWRGAREGGALWGAAPPQPPGSGGAGVHSREVAPCPRRMAFVLRTSRTLPFPLTQTRPLLQGVQSSSRALSAPPSPLCCSWASWEL